MEKIDFVIPWVDGSDPAWREEFQRYSPTKGTDAGENRYRDWNNLRYLLPGDMFRNGLTEMRRSFGSFAMKIIFRQNICRLLTAIRLN